MQAGDYMSLSVADTGTGMTPEVIARAFDPFFTTKPLGQGTGLGLSMIYGFARQSGGAVRIESKPGVGTAMRLYLPPHHQAEAPVVPLAAASPATRAGHGDTALVIDDEPTVRMLVTEILQSAGYRVEESGDAPSGLARLRSGDRFDLLVTDVGLPGGMNGRQVADAARALRPELRVLFITGYAEKSALGAGQLAAGMRILTKPFTTDALMGAVDALMRA